MAKLIDGKAIAWRSTAEKIKREVEALDGARPCRQALPLLS